MNLQGSYILLAHNVHLHELPRGAFIVITTTGRTSPSVIWSYINETAKQILLNCNGNLTAEAVIKKVCPDPSIYAPFLDSSLAFLKEAFEKGHILASDAPIPVLYPKGVGGSSKVYMPVQAIMELTYGCNLRCRHCYVEASPQREERLSYQSFLELIDLLQRQGVVLVELTGGEPLTHPDFQAILMSCLERFQLVTVLSNGTMVDEKLVKLIRDHAQRLVFSVTLFSSTPAFHDSFSGINGAFERTCRAIRLLSQSGVRLRVSAVFSRENYSDVENMVALAHELGATQLTYSPVLNLGRAQGGNWQLSEEETIDFSKRIERVIKEWGKFIQIIPEHVAEWIKERGCGAGWRTIIIDPIGNIRPCVMMSPNLIRLGNIFKDKYEEIFSRPTVAKLANLQPPSEKICGDCSKLAFCVPCHLRGIMSYQSGTPCKWAALQGIDALLGSAS